MSVASGSSKPSKNGSKGKIRGNLQALILINPPIQRTSGNWSNSELQDLCNLLGECPRQREGNDLGTVTNNVQGLN